MSAPFSRLIAVLTLAGFSWGFPLKAIAQEYQNQLIAPNPIAVDVIISSSPANLQELINDAFSENSGDFFEQAAAEGVLNSLFGWREFPEGSYDENSIARDGLLLSTIVRDYFRQLVQREPTIRTRDIVNPFSTSLQENPSFVRQ